MKAAEKAVQLGLLLCCCKPYAQLKFLSLPAGCTCPIWQVGEVELGLWGFIGGVGLGLGCVVYWVLRHLALGVLWSDSFKSTLC